MTVDELLARQQIGDVLHRYCRGIDRMDRALVAGCYHPGATDSHGSFEGTADEFVEWCFGLLAKYDSTFHFLGSTLIDVMSETEAFSETYGLAHHRKSGGGAHHNLITGFRFLDTFERRSGVWAIAERVAVTEWSSVDASPWPMQAGMLRGRRDGGDPLYRHIERP